MQTVSEPLGQDRLFVQFNKLGSHGGRDDKTQ